MATLFFILHNVIYERNKCFENLIDKMIIFDKLQELILMSFRVDSVVAAFDEVDACCPLFLILRPQVC